MTDEFDKANELLQVAFQRYRSYMADGSYFNTFAAIGKERDETQVHSKIIYFLLNSKDGYDSFLKLFLQTIHVPEHFWDDRWLVCRERVFDSGRMDFVLESQSFCAVIEMKIDAEDGECQLERYDSFCRKRKKEYLVYYLTLDGREPSEQSIGTMNQNQLCRISFQKEIVEWIEKCMETVVDKTGYKYSFLKQYLGAVRHMTGMDREDESVEDLITESGMGKAAMIVMDSFRKKMKNILESFFHKLRDILEEGAGLDTYVYEDEIRQYYSSKYARSGTETIIECINYKNKIYDFVFCLEVDYYLYASFGFVEDTEDTWIPLDNVREIIPDFYNKWIEKIKILEIPMLKQSTDTFWYYIENTRGEMFDFRNYGDPVIALIDEMDDQCKFIGENIINQVLIPLASYIRE